MLTGMKLRYPTEKVLSIKEKMKSLKIKEIL